MRKTETSRIALRVLACLLIAGAAIAAGPPVVTDQAKISDASGGIDGALDPQDIFGSAVDGIGDLDGDGVPDLVVGAPLDDDGDFDAGAIWVFFMNGDGGVEDFQKISDVFGDFDDILREDDEFGTAVTSLGDLDGDGVVDLAVGAPFDDDGEIDAGAVWIVFLNDDGTVKSTQKISELGGDFEGILNDGDGFGFGVDNIGDLDGDGVVDIAVGAPFDNEGDGQNSGAVWILFLNDDGTVKDFQKISEVSGGFQGNLSANDTFGTSVSNLGDVNGDSITDIAVGVPLDDAGNGSNVGAFWVLFLGTDGRVKNEQKISDENGDFVERLDDEDWFGWSVAGLGDVDGDDIPDVAAGTPNDDAGSGHDKGAVFLILLNGDGTVKTASKINEGAGGFRGDLDEFDAFGSAVASVGDIDDDGTDEIAVGSAGDNDGAGFNAGAVWVLFMEPGAPLCGDADDGGTIEATDALIALRTAVGTATCDLCACDVDSSGAIVASDAQRILAAAIGNAVTLQCPACG